MKVALLLVCLLSVVAADRLIAFNETHREWISEEKMEALYTSSRKNFMDVTDFPDAKPLPGQAPFEFPNQPRHKEEVHRIMAGIDKDSMREELTTLSQFFTRWYTTPTGTQSADWIYSTLVSIKGAREDVTVEYFQHSWAQPSIIARIQGSTEMSDGIIVVGAHLDSVGSTSTGRAPGSDDDGSGTICTMEIFRLLVTDATFRPTRDLEFHFYAAEEAGLLGSQAVANAYQGEGKTVHAMLQLDMTMYASYAPPIVMSPITDFTSAGMNDFIRLMIDTYTDMEWENSRCGYGCSDHASWTRIGVDSAFIFEAPFNKRNPYIHSPNDDMSHVSIEHGVEFVKMGLAHMIELSYLPTSQ